jgi:hypothetical protein
MARRKVFISYSHKDARWLDSVREQLAVLEREGLIDVFEDTRIGAGEEWYPRLNDEMLEARLSLLLISPAFLTSTFIREEEVPRLFGQHEVDGMAIYPLLIRDCPWQEVSWLTRWQMRPTDARPVASLRGAARDKCLADVAREIASIMKSTSAPGRSRSTQRAKAVGLLRPESNVAAAGRAGVERRIEDRPVATGRSREAGAQRMLHEPYRDNRVESVRTQLIQVHAHSHDPGTFLRSRVFPILRGLFVDRNTFNESIRDCRDEAWTERFIAAIETRRLMEAYRAVMIDHAKPGDEELVRSYDQLNLHRFLQELTGLFKPRPAVNEITERLQKGDVEAVKKELERAEIRPKERIGSTAIKACDGTQKGIKRIWKQWPIIQRD